jgi:hypothetical protein
LKNKKYEVIFTKKNILIEMLINGDDFYSLFKYKYTNSEIIFNKSLNFKNIFEFHMDLIKEIIINSKRDINDFNFYLVDLIDIKEVDKLVKNLFLNYEKNLKNEIIIPDVKYYTFYMFDKFNNYFDFNFYFE